MLRGVDQVLATRSRYCRPCDSKGHGDFDAKMRRSGRLELLRGPLN